MNLIISHSRLFISLFIFIILSSAGAQEQILLRGASNKSFDQIQAINARLGVIEIKALSSESKASVLTVPTSQRQEWLNEVGKLRQTNGDMFSVMPLQGDYRSLFYPAPKGQDLNPIQQKALQAVRKSNGAENVSLVSIAPPVLALQALTVGFNTQDGFRQPGTIRIGLEPGRTVAFVQQRSTPVGDGYIWTGKPSPNSSGEKQEGEATLITRGDQVTGSVRVGKQTYDIIGIGGGLHAVAKRDAVISRPEHPPRFEEKEKRPMTFDLPPPSFPEISEIITVDVLIAFSKQTAEERPDRASLAILAVEQLNRSLLDSGVASVHVRLVRSMDVSYSEEINWKNHLDRLSNVKDKIFLTIHKVRNEVKADLVVLFVSDLTYCGEAQAINAISNTAFAVVSQSCATTPSYHSFAHEIGHLLGARHDRQSDPNLVPFKWAHGYVNADKWRTIMAYDICGGCIRVLRWSNPNVNYENESTGDTEFEYDARVWMESAKRVARFR